MKNLVLLVADKNAHFALKGALGRPAALGIAPIEFEFRVHPGRDGGVRKNGPDALAREFLRFKHALLVLDFEGSGSELSNAGALEAQLNSRLESTWGNSAKCVVIEPEVDVWIWGSDNAVEEVIEWRSEKRLREWLRNEGYTFDTNDKPSRPKEAIEAALKIAGTPRSSALYQRIAEKISLSRCADNAFLRLKNQLREWFPR
jgi:hypothetical protein